jgi:3-deoxy-D-manno-octulosonate 8-phosphate phosphatase (KDO 8-P phosphatase)
MKDLSKIKLIVVDVDGTLTDGGVYIDSNGIETKKFNIKDGAGILMAENVGIDFMILTGRRSECVEHRAKELKIKYIYQNILEKGAFLQNFIEINGLNKENIAYIGDDLNDMPAMECAGIKACPFDASDEIKAICDYTLSLKGGFGVVREFVNMLLESIDKYNEAK